MRSIVLAGLCSLVAGCFAPKYSNGSLRCESGTTCPDGYHCAPDNTCWKNGSDPMLDMSLGGDVLDGAMPDLIPPPPLTYPPAAVWISCGGGAVVAASGAQLATSACELSIAGSATGSAGSTVSYGYFSADTF